MKAILLHILVLVASSAAKFNHLVIPYYPHRSDCGKYVLRDWDIEVTFECPAGLHWNDIKKTCDEPWRSGCSTELATRSVASNYQLVQCPTMLDHYSVVYLVHSDKSKFYMCSASELLEFSCHSSCIFNIQATRCDCFQEADWISTTPPVEVYTRTPATAPGNCPSTIDPHNPVFFPHSDCGKFYVCTLKGLVETSCHDEFHWNAATNRCERPWDAGCVTMGLTSPKTTSSPTLVTTHNIEEGGVDPASTTELPTELDDNATTDDYLDEVTANDVQ